MEPSKTAVATLIARAAHQALDPVVAYEDPVAVRLYAGHALAKAVEARATNPAGFELLRAHVAERTVHAESALREAVEQRGVEQYVILGAGYDTFAYRQPAWASNLRIFEVDQPATQASKRAALHFGGMVEPQNVSYFAIDFEKTPLRDGLRAGGVDLTRPIFFSWLGVTIYLTRAAVETTLGEVARCAPQSEIAFTFGRQSSETAWGSKAAAVGEPWLTTFDPSELETLLTHEFGFEHVSIAGPNALARCRANRLS